MKQEREDEDLIGGAIRRAYHVPSQLPERFEELLRQLARKDAAAPEDSWPLTALF